MKRKSTQAIILLAFAKVIISLVASLFFFSSPEARGWIYPCLLGAIIGLAFYASMFAWGGSSNDPTLPTVVASLPDEMSASAVVSQLEVHGIKARAVGGFTSGFQTEIASDVKVVVAAQDVELARAALQKSMELST
jgi:hypothetical protein